MDFKRVSLLTPEGRRGFLSDCAGSRDVQIEVPEVFPGKDSPLLGTRDGEGGWPLTPALPYFRFAGGETPAGPSD